MRHPEVFAERTSPDHLILLDSVADEQVAVCCLRRSCMEGIDSAVHYLPCSIPCNSNYFFRSLVLVVPRNVGGRVPVVIFTVCSFIEAGSCHICKCHILVHIYTRIIHELRCVETVFSSELKIFENKMEHLFAVFAASIKQGVVRLEIPVDPWDVSEGLELAHMCISPPESCDSEIVVVDLLCHVALGLVHVLYHIVHLAQEAPAARTPATAFVGVPYARVVLVCRKFCRAEVRVGVVSDGDRSPEYICIGQTV